MLSFTAVTTAPEKQSPWMATGLAALISAVIALVTALLFQSARSPLVLVLYVIAFLLIGAAPVLGYSIAHGKLGREWKPLIGGIVGFILTFILWPILVGALDKSQSIGRLLLASVVGFIIGVGGLLLLGTIAGQDPAWFQWGWVILWALWGGACGWAMSAWSKPEEAVVVTQ